MVLGTLLSANAPDDIAGHPLSGWVQAAIATGCMTANPAGDFNPDAPVTRAQLAVVVACLGGEDERAAIPAPDPCTVGDMPACIRQEWAWTGDQERAVALAWCESKHIPWAVNVSSGASGLFQFLPSTWTAWGEGDVLDPKANAAAAARLWEALGPSQWECRT